MESKSEYNSIDIVALYPNGSLASTSSEYVNYGLPSEQIMAVFLSGHIHLNMHLNFHEIYQLPHLKHLGKDHINLVTVARDKTILNRCAISHDASWDYCIKTTADEWELIGLGGEEFSYIAHPVNNARNKRDTIAESVLKDWHYIQPLLKQDEETRKNFFKFVENEKKRLANEALEQVALNKKVLGYPAVYEIPAKIIKDRSNKRKTSGDQKLKISKKK